MSFHLCPILLLLLLLSVVASDAQGDAKKSYGPKLRTALVRTLPPSTASCQENLTFKSVLCTGSWPMPTSLSPEIQDVTVFGVDERALTLAMIQRLNVNLRTLRLWKCNVNQVDVNALSFSSQLRELDLADNQLATLPAGLFSWNAALERIVLRKNRLTGLERGLLAVQTGLMVLDLSQNRLTQVPADLPKSIKELYLAQNPITTIEILPLPNLQRLDLCATQVGVFSDSLAEGFRKLDSLCLGGAKLEASSTGLAKLNELTRLTLEAPGETVMQTKVLESMSSLTRLTSLVIEKYELQSLTVVAQFSQLETLALRRVFVKETPTASIFHQLPHLKVLDLSGSASLVRKTLFVPSIRQSLLSLTTLDVRQCDLRTLEWIPVHRNAGASASKGQQSMPSLTSVDVSMNPLDCADPATQQVLCGLRESTTPLGVKPRIVVEKIPDPFADPALAAMTTPAPWYGDQHVSGFHNIDQTECSVGADKQPVGRVLFPSCETSSQAPDTVAVQRFPDVANDTVDVGGNGTLGTVVDAEQFDPYTYEAVELTLTEKWYVAIGVLLVVLAILAAVLFYLHCRRKAQAQQAVSADSELPPCAPTQQEAPAEVPTFKVLKDKDSQEHLVK